MREILFRGKRVDNGKWIEGSLSTEYYKECGCIMVSPTSDDCFKVDPETVGQYTGLCDRNRKKIFEGDIVNYNGSIHKVVFENRCYNARFGIVVEEKETWSFGMSVPPYLMEVIGNIHDNPELTGGNTHG